MNITDDCNADIKKLQESVPVDEENTGPVGIFQGIR